jgi:hypothetical protein
MSGSGSWASASDLADYTYCPRSHWYHDHPPDGAPNRSARDREEAGRRYHARALSGERRRAEHGGAYWAALALGLLLAVGSLAWIFRP